MKTRLFFSVLGLLFSVLGAPAQTLYKNVQKTTDGNNGLVENLTVPTGRTLARTGSGVITLSDTLANLSVTNGAALDSWAAITRASGFDTFAATPSSANLDSLVTDDTGSGALVFATSPTLVTPNIGAATGTSLTLSSLTSGRVPYATTSGLLTDSANLTFNGSTLTLAGGVASTSTSTGTLVLSGSGGLGVGGAGYFGGGLNLPSTAGVTLNSNSLLYAPSSSTVNISVGGTDRVQFGNSAGSGGFITLARYDGGLSPTIQGADITGAASALSLRYPGGSKSAIDLLSNQINFMTGASNTLRASINSAGDFALTSTADATTGGAGSLTTAGGIYAAKKIYAATNILSTGPTAGIGYDTGAGGTVTQASSRTTGVTLNKVTGAITLVSAAGSASWQSFTVTNSAVAATDSIILNQVSGTDLYLLHVTAVGAGSFRITFATTGGTTTEQPVIRFTVIKSVSS